MKIATTIFFILLLSLYSFQLCFAQGKKVTAEKLTKGDVKKALLSGEITSNCGMLDISDPSATSLNPDTVKIRAIYQRNGKAKINFMGRLKKNVRTDEKVVICVADLVRLESGEWMDPNSGALLKK